LAGLVLGPLLRHVGTGHATVWVETDAPCEVAVLGATQRTFAVEGHHFALIHVTDLPDEGTTSYEVALDGARVWPPADWEWPASVIRTVRDDHGVSIAFGSCRCTYPNEPPYTLSKDEDPRGREHDALRALALRMRDEDPDRWPHLLLLLGDQVYADEISPITEAYIRERRDPDIPPGLQIADFEEYCHLYAEAWSDPTVRWLLSTVPTAMIFDDHDVIDDWNTSRDWVTEARALGWWDARIVGAFMSYWCYQHLGNLAPEDRAEDECYRAVLATEGDAGAVVRNFAFRADREVAGARWSYRRDLGRTRLVMMDSRAGRVLQPGSRSMVDAGEWDCIEEWSQGDFDHLLMGTSLPALLDRGAHHLEAWNERVCDGAWGRVAARLGEKLRRAVDLEHWAAFGDSLRALERLLERIASGAASPHGRPPGSIVLLSGDVHHAYIARARFASHEEGAPVYQAVCSPLRNPLDSGERRAIRLALSGAAERAGALLARAAGVEPESMTWRVTDGPWFDNQIAMLEIDGRHIAFRLEKAIGPADGPPRLQDVAHRFLA
jgi:hypothetical protein